MSRWDARGAAVAGIVVTLLTAVVLVAAPTGHRGAGASPPPGADEAARRSAAQARAQLDADAVSQLADGLIARRLAGRRVLLVGLPGASGRDVTAVRGALARAGAEVSGTVELLPAYVDPVRASELEALVTRLLPPGVSMPTQRRSSTVAAAVLARSVLAPRASGTGDVADAGAALLAGLRYAGFARVQGSPATGATLAVVVAPPTRSTPDAQAAAADADAAAVDLVAGLRARAAGLVLAAPHQPGRTDGVVAAVRRQSLAPTPSTVDAVDTAVGPLAVVLALAEQLRGGNGHYGDGPGASAALPSLPPTPR